jgi:hypothetical protein
LDANIIFSQNEKGFVGAKIQVIDKKEQINGYQSPEEEVTGWSIQAPEKSNPAPVEMSQTDPAWLGAAKSELDTITNLPSEENILPF